MVGIYQPPNTKCAKASYFQVLIPFSSFEGCTQGLSCYKSSHESRYKWSCILGSNEPWKSKVLDCDRSVGHANVV